MPRFFMQDDSLDEDFQLAGRALPSAHDAEVYLLGGLIQDSTALSDLVTQLEPENFLTERHRILWAALQELYRRSVPVDFVTLSELLKADGTLEKVGGQNYLLELINTVPSAANAAYHAELVKEKSVLRQLIDCSNQTIGEAMDVAAVSEEVLQASEARIFALAQKRVKNTLKPISSLITPLLEAIMKRKEGVTGVRTGFTDLDALTGGLQKSDLIVLAGRPGMGKTAFALTLAANAAIDNGYSVAFFSLEMSADQLLQRVLSSRSGVELHRLRSGKLSSDEIKKLTLVCEPIGASKFQVDDNSDLGISELMSKSRKLKSSPQGLDLLIVDYLQLMRTGKEENRAVAIGAISRGLKILAKELEIPIIALAQLSRKAEDKGKERPLLSDLRESGSIEQDADMVWFVDRPFYRSHDESQKLAAQLQVAKHRNGSVGDIDLIFQAEIATFRDAVKDDGDFGGMEVGGFDDFA